MHNSFCFLDDCFKTCVFDFRVETLGNECVVKIDKVHEKDEGTWQCEFLYHKENVARTEKKNFSVSIANFSKDAPIITLSQSDEKDTETYT